METAAAIALINELISGVAGVRGNTTLFDAWRRKCRTVLDRIFGEDSKQTADLMNVNFEHSGISYVGDNTPHVQAFHRGLDKSIEMLRSFIWEIEQFGIPQVATRRSAKQAMRIVEAICDRFHSVATQLRHRHSDRETLDVSDEYDVQDLLHALLRLHFDDIRPEEWTPSYAGSSKRMDFLLKYEQIVIEVKMARKGLDAKKVGEELTIDIAHYQAHHDCKTLICFVYDPENRIVNPIGLATDLDQQSEAFSVRVVISPKC